MLFLDEILQEAIKQIGGQVPNRHFVSSSDKNKFLYL